MTPTNHWPLRSYLELGPLPSAAPRARLHTSQVLRKWDLDDLGEPTELVVSELITNAIHASGLVSADTCVRLWLFSDGTLVVVHVWDNCPDPPQPSHAASTDEDGRGLLLVKAMTTSWDWYARDGGKIVWAVVQFSPLLNRTETLGHKGSQVRPSRTACAVGSGTLTITMEHP
jgi:anti-sigma regulatory factor (Ser/Thr protein kinase)